MWLMSERIDKDKSSGAYQDGIIDIAGEKIEVIKITGASVWHTFFMRKPFTASPFSWHRIPF